MLRGEEFWARNMDSFDGSFAEKQKKRHLLVLGSFEKSKVDLGM